MPTANEPDCPSRVPTEVEALQIRMKFADYLLEENEISYATDMSIALNALADGKLYLCSAAALAAFELFCAETEIMLSPDCVADTSNMVAELYKMLEELLEVENYEDDDEEEEEEEEGGEGDEEHRCEAVWFMTIFVPIGDVDQIGFFLSSWY